MNTQTKYMPDLRSAHDVRKIRVCQTCKQMGCAPYMLQFGEAYEHGSCYVERLGVASLCTLPVEQMDKLALGDIGGDAMHRLMIARSAAIGKATQ